LALIDEGLGRRRQADRRRAKAYRARQATGDAVLQVRVPAHRLAAVLLEAGLCDEQQSRDRAFLAEAVAAVVRQYVEEAERRLKI
jgi:hypothetical protein